MSTVRPEHLTNPGSPEMLNHVAYITHDTAATVRFYKDVMGMDFVSAVMDDKIPSTGDPVPYFHSFFKMADGSTIAFFEAPLLPPEGEVTHPAYNIFNHLALQVASKELVDQWAAWVRGHGVDVIGPVDHGIIYSVYFYDPNGIRLEITTNVDPNWKNHAAEAQESLADWEAAKEVAKSSGRSLVDVMEDLTRERSHRRTNQLD